MRAASLVIVAAALLLASPASAANALDVGAIDASQYPTLRLSVVTPEPTAAPPSIRENGQRVVGFSAENLARAKSIVLAIDRSRSMDGTALANAVAAARSFAASKAPADRLMLVGFGRQAVRLTGFSTATIDADAALASLSVDAKQGTALYDAVALGARALDAEPLPGRVLIVLTDGDDVSSRTSLAQAATDAKRAGAAVYAIGIQGEGFSPDALQDLARVTGGRYFPAASSASVAGAYSAIAEQLRRTWRLTYVSAARPGQSVKVAVAAAGGTGSTQARMPGNSTVITPKSGPNLIPKFLYENNIGTVLLALFTGSCVILAVGLAVATPGGTRLRRRLEPHTAVTKTRRDRDRGAPKERFAAASGMLSATEKSLGHLRLWRHLHRLIERADLPLRTVEFFYICVGSSLLLGLLGAFAGLPAFLLLLLLVAGGAAPIVYVTFKARKRLAKLDDQLPDILQTMAASLKAGHSFRQGLQSVVDEGQAPASEEFKRVLTETSLGRPMDHALEEMSERVGSKNLDFVITAVTIQRQVGGSLASIFDMVADAVRQRQQFVKKVRGLTAMGRLSAYVLVGLPFFMAFMFTLLNPTYMQPLWQTSAGHKIIFAGLMMMTFGSLILKKIVSFKG